MKSISLIFSLFLVAFVSSEDVLRYTPQSSALGNWLSVNTRTKSGVYTWQVNSGESVNYYIICGDESTPKKNFGSLSSQQVITTVCPPATGITFGWFSGINQNLTGSYYEAISNVIELPITEMVTGNNYTAYGPTFKVFHYTPQRFLLRGELANYFEGSASNYLTYDDPNQPGSFYIVANKDFRFDILNFPEDPFTYVVNDNEQLNITYKAYTNRYFCGDAPADSLALFSFDRAVDYTVYQFLGKHCATYYNNFDSFLNVTYFTRPFVDVVAGNNLAINDKCTDIKNRGGYNYIPIRIGSLGTDLYRMSKDGGATFSDIFFGNNPPNGQVSSSGAFNGLYNCANSLLFTITSYSPVIVDVSSSEKKWNTLFTVPSGNSLEWVKLTSNDAIFIDSISYQPIGSFSSYVPQFTTSENLYYLSSANPLYFRIAGSGDYNLTITRLHFYNAGDIYNQDYPIPHLYFPAQVPCLLLELSTKFTGTLNAYQNSVLASRVHSGFTPLTVAKDGGATADSASVYVFCRASNNNQDAYLKLTAISSGIKFSISTYTPSNLTFGQSVRPRIAQNVNVYTLPGIQQKSAAFMFYSTLTTSVNALTSSASSATTLRLSQVVTTTGSRQSQFVSNFDDNTVFLVAAPTGGNFTAHLTRPEQSVCANSTECPKNSKCVGNYCQCVGDFYGPFCNTPGKLSGASALTFSYLVIAIIYSFFFVL
eukprot:TRINITY_DN2861_c0_g1_i1.p1 TRINITY_DN2861_c0_g1~~TRINITY_DN2861_c0_g1_i1.p1  ORF type:complete len:708 (-),score=198.06 TRINITY_DN2861_c0_g1_i1:58-2181(-)